MNVNDFGHVSIVFEHDMMSAHAYRVKSFNFSNICIRIRIRTDFYIKIRIRRMRILINSVTSLKKTHPALTPASQYSIYLPRRDGRLSGVDQGDWLHAEMVYVPTDSQPSKY